MLIHVEFFILVKIQFGLNLSYPDWSRMLQRVCPRVVDRIFHKLPNECMEWLFDERRDEIDGMITEKSLTEWLWDSTVKHHYSTLESPFIQVCYFSIISIVSQWKGAFGGIKTQKPGGKLGKNPKTRTKFWQNPETRRQKMENPENFIGLPKLLIA